MSFCTHCGAKMDDDLKYCPSCGWEVDSEEVPDQYLETGAEALPNYPLDSSQTSTPQDLTQVQPRLAPNNYQQSGYTPQQPAYPGQQPVQQASFQSQQSRRISTGALIAIIACAILIPVGVLAVWLTGPFSPFAPQEEEAQEQIVLSKSGSNGNGITNKTVTFDFTEPFYAVLYEGTGQSSTSVQSWSSDSAAQSKATELSDDGYPAEVMNGKAWSGPVSSYNYIITFGTWKTSTEAQEMVDLLKSAGYAAKVEYSGQPAVTREDPNTVFLGVVSQNGTRLSDTIHFRSNEQVIPDSSTRLYSYSELANMGLNDAELCIAWNEPFARLGYHFENPDLNNYFSARSWYHDTGRTNISLTGNAATNNTNLRKLADTNSSTSELWKHLSSSTY